ncbi:MAG: Wzz/FepE/Etk N-terminal domain-containing protein [Betaproteobacteria bacterium]
MNLHQFLLALRARLGVFVLVLVATVLAAAGVSLMMAKTYKATVSLLVDAKEEQSLNGGRPLIQPQERLSYLQTQKDILTSKKVARKVVQEMKLTEKPAALATLVSEEGSSNTLEDRAVEGLLKKLKVETTQSNVIDATFSSSDPYLSMQVANAFAKGYIETLLELRTQPAKEAAAWFDDQLKSLRANLEEAQNKLTDNHQRKQIVSEDERGDVESGRLAALSDELVRAQEQTYQWNTREQEARKFLQAGASPDRLPEVLDNSFVQRLKGDLLQGETRLREMSTQYGSNHPQYQRQVSENESLRERLDIEMRKVISGIENSARQARQREGALARSLGAQRSRMLGQKESRNDFTVLRRNVESAERAYDTAMQRAVISQVESRANQTSVSVLNPAVVPRMPSSPKIVMNIALALAVGVMLGVGIVMLMEITDRRVRSLNDLDNASNIPLLGELKPWRPAHHLLGQSRRNQHALPNPG